MPKNRAGVVYMDRECCVLGVLVEGNGGAIVGCVGSGTDATQRRPSYDAPFHKPTVTGLFVAAILPAQHAPGPAFTEALRRHSRHASLLV